MHESVPAEPANFYARWRIDSGIIIQMREGEDHPPERLLQAIWQHQRLHRDKLLTLDGRGLRILHPGFRSVEGGPDFRQAIVQIGDNSPVTGDIEVDLRSSGWRGHRHHENPAFKNVILHVLWDCDKPASGTPPAVENDILDRKSTLQKPCAASVAPRSENSRPRAKPNCCIRRRWFDCKIKPARSRLERSRPVGNNPFGKDSFAPWVTSTTPGQCNGLPN